MMKRILIYVVFVFPSLVYGQNAVSDFKKVSDYLRNTPLAFDITYSLYGKYNSDVKVQEKKASYSLWQDMLYYQMEDIELVTNDRFMVSVDKTKKAIVLNKSNPAFEKRIAKEINKFNVDSLFAKRARTELLSSESNKHVWRLWYHKSVRGIGYTDVVIRIPEYLIEKVTLYYSSSFDDMFNQAPKKFDKTDKPRMEVVFANYRKLDKADKEKIFYASHILELAKDGKVKLKDPYTSYKLANYYNTK